LSEGLTQSRFTVIASGEAHDHSLISEHSDELAGMTHLL